MGRNNAGEHARGAICLTGVDLDRHLENDMDVKAVIPDVPVSAQDDFALHEALSILKGAGILTGKVNSETGLDAEQEQ